MGPTELTCPMCGALIIADRGEDIVVLAREHTIDAHDYRIPAEHVHAALANPGDPHPEEQEPGS